MILRPNDVSDGERGGPVVSTSAYLALLLVLVDVREEIFRELESDGEENKQRIEDLGVQGLMTALDLYLA